jgi:hypothetical protein
MSPASNGARRTGLIGDRKIPKDRGKAVERENREIEMKYGES